LSGPNVEAAYIPGSEGTYAFENIFNLDYNGVCNVEQCLGHM